MLAHYLSSILFPMADICVAYLAQDTDPHALP